MRIDGFHVENFGILHDMALENLPSMVVFLGQNEAGKSTLLEFFRSSLTGYPKARSTEAKHYVANQQDGGTLVLSEADTIMRLTRHYAARGGSLSLADAQGNPLDVSHFDRLMQGVDREIYCSIYGFGLGELQNVATLTNDGVRNALYGASFGMGLQAPQAIIDTFNNEQLEIFRPGGSRHALKPLMNEYEAIEQEIKRISDDMSRYDAMMDELAQSREHEQALREERTKLDRKRRNAERRLSAWAQWEQWQRLGLRLLRIPLVAATFPVDGNVRMEHICNNLTKAEHLVQNLEARCENTREALEACKTDIVLLEAAPSVHALHEHKQTIRITLESIPHLNTRLEQCDTAMQAHLTSLGEGWTAARVQGRKALYQDIALREQFEHHVTAVQDATAQLATEKALVNNHEQATGEALRAFEEATSYLLSLPKPAMELDISSKAFLQTGVAQCHEASAQLAARQEDIRNTKTQYAQALNQLDMAQEHPPLDFFESTLQAQIQLNTLATEIRQDTAYLQAAERKVEDAQSEIAQAKAHIETVQEEGESLQGADRHTLESQRKALHRLRETTHALHLEQEYLALQARLPSSSQGVPKLYQSIALWLGLISVFAGTTFLTFYYILRGQAFAENILAQYPLQAWPAWLTVIAGLSLVGFAVWRARSFEPQALHISQHTGTNTARIAVLTAECIALCEQAGMDFDQANMAGHILQHEELLAREQERCAAFERWQASRMAQQERMQILQNNLALCEESVKRDQAALQDIRKQWQALVELLHLPSLLEPHALEIFWARLENARIQALALVRLEHEIATLDTRIQTFLTKAHPLLAYYQNISEDTDIYHDTPKIFSGDTADALLLKIEEALAANQADEHLRIERTQAQEAIRTAKNHLERTKKLYAEAEGSFEAATHKYTKTQEAWQEHLEMLGLGTVLLHERSLDENVLAENTSGENLPNTSLSGASARQALECIQKILHTLDEKAHIQASLTHEEQRIADFTTQFTTLCTSLGRDILPSSDNSHTLMPVENLTLLDTLMQALEEARTNDEEAKRLTDRLKEYTLEYNEALRHSLELVETRDALFSLAHVSDLETFLQHHIHKVERDACLIEYHILEDALRVVAEQTTQQESFNDFIAAFENDDRDNLAIDLQNLEENLIAHQNTIEQIGQKAHLLEDTLQSLRSSTRLAELREERNAVQEQALQYVRTWAQYALAKHLFTLAKKRFEKEQQPHVMASASNLLQTITNNAWSHITTSLDDASLHVMTPAGAPRSTETLSRGTQEQAYLALRLAHIRNHAMQATALPIISDDVLVNFDAKRMEQTIKVLASMTQDSVDVLTGKLVQGHQILFFTCHEHIAKKVQKLVPDAALHVLEHGRLR